MSAIPDVVQTSPRQTWWAERAARLSAGGVIGRTRISAFFSILARVFNAGVLLLTHVLLARLIGVDSFGLFSLAVTWVMTLVGLATLGLTMTPQRFAPGYLMAGQHGLLAGLFRFAQAGPVAAGLALALGGAALLWFAPFAMSPEVRLVIAVALMALPALAVIDVVEGFALANEWHDLAYGITFGVKPLLLPVLALGLWGGFGWSGALPAVVAFVAASWIAAAMLVVALRRRMRPQIAGAAPQNDYRAWFSLAVPALLADGAFLAMAYVDVLVLAAHASAADVGIYVAATKIAGLVAFIHYGLSYAAAHHFAALHAAGDRAALLAYARQAARWTFWPALVAGVVILALSPWLLALFGRDFAGGGGVLPLLIGALLLRAVIGPSEQLLMMSNRQRQVTTIYGAAAALNLTCAMLLAPWFGATGVALAVLGATLLAAVWTAIAVRRALGGWVHAFAIGSPTKLHDHASPGTDS